MQRIKTKSKETSGAPIHVTNDMESLDMGTTCQNQNDALSKIRLELSEGVSDASVNKKNSNDRRCKLSLSLTNL